MARRTSYAAGPSNTWVSRTPSGLPLCPICRKELGFCPHSSIGTRERSKSISGAGAASTLPSTLPAAIAMNTDAEAPQASEGDEPRRNPENGGRKRRGSGTQGSTPAKVQRRGRSTMGKGGSASAAALNTAKNRTKRPPRRSPRFVVDDGQSGGRSAASGSDDGCGDTGRRGSVPRHDHLLRFPGFSLNESGKECLGCYEVARITISFVCEDRRMKEVERQAAAAAEAQSTAACGSGNAEDAPATEDAPAALMGGLEMSVPHVMCVECFRVFLESRVTEGKLVTSRDFDSYTVGCPMGCADSCVNPACFQDILGEEFMLKYRRFAAIHLANHMRIVWCPGCHCGVVPSAAAAAAAKAARQNPVPSIPPPPPSRSMWGFWGNRAGVEPAATTEPPSRPSNCIGCPGCQASLCMSCKALHDPGVSCADARAEADAKEAMMNREAHGGGEGGEDGGGRAGGTERRASIGLHSTGQFEESSSTKRCPNCHVPIFKDGGCNHMRCGMCQQEFCWLHLTPWVVGGPCQRGHWSNDPVLNRAYNAQRVAAAGFREGCTIS